MTKLFRTLLPAFPLLLIHAAAHGQATEKSVFDGDFLTLGGGVGYGPDWAGANDSSAFPVGGVMGQIGPIGINPRASGVALDVIPDVNRKLSFSLGPVISIRTDRTGKITDPVVAALGGRNTAVEAGGTAGLSLNRLANPYDSLSFSVDVSWDIAKAHRGAVITPSLTYLTPLSRGTAAMLSISAQHVNTAYAGYYFDVTPAGALASGLPVYTARSGWKNGGATLVGIVDLDGDLLNGGFALVGGVSYSRLLGSIADSPIVVERGSPNQFVGALGIAYTF